MEDTHQCDSLDMFRVNLKHLREELKNEVIERNSIRIVEDSERERVMNELKKYITQMYAFTKDQEIEIVDRNSWLNVEFDNKRGLVMKSKIVRFNRISHQRQAKMLCIMAEMYFLMLKNEYKLKRDLFYKHKDIFSDQRVLDAVVEDICCFLKTTRYQLHILSTCKGLVYGDVTITFADGSIINCLGQQQGFTLPHDVCKVRNITSTADFVIIVEKDASMQPLIASGITQDLNCILITGKGFPDSNTRQMVRFMSELLRIPMFALVDSDPYGIEIMFVYKFGSLAQAHDSDNCTATQIKWLGLHPSDVEESIYRSRSFAMNQLDQRKVELLMDRIYIRDNPRYLSELQSLRNFGRKAEIQAFPHEYLAKEFIPNKIRNGEWL